METALENILMTGYKVEMISFMHAHPEYFDEAIELALSDKHPLSFRAAWLIYNSMEDNDKRLQGHIRHIIDALKTKKKDGHQRELLKLLLRMDLGDEFEGEVFDLCVRFWEQINKISSVRCIAFEFIHQTAQKHPELKNEIAVLTHSQYLETLSPGLKDSISQMIKCV